METRKEDDPDKNYFEGEFEVLSYEVLCKDGSWVRVPSLPCEKKEFDWRFGEPYVRKYDSGEIVYEGSLYVCGEPPKNVRSSYAYCPAEKLLYIEDILYYDDGVWDMYYSDRYRVYPREDGKIHLFNMEGVEKEPDDYVVRMIITPCRR